MLSTKSLVQHIDRFGIFDLEKTGIKLENRPGGDEDEIELVLSLREKGRLYLKAGTEVGGGEGGGVRGATPEPYHGMLIWQDIERHCSNTKCSWRR